MKKSNLQIIVELKDSGKLKPLIRAGLFPAKIITHLEIYYYVKSKTHVNVGKTTAVTWASDMFGVSVGQVYKIIKALDSK